MIHLLNSDIFHSSAQLWVNPVNCKGTMGAGLAKKFDRTFPDNTEQYKLDCQNGVMKIGVVTTHPTGIFTPMYIANLPTKDDWRDPSEYAYIQSGLNSLVDAVAKLPIASIAIPALGCGLGGLEWTEVYRIMRSCFESPLMDKYRVEIYGPR